MPARNCSHTTAISIWASASGFSSLKWFYDIHQPFCSLSLIRHSVSDQEQGQITPTEPSSWKLISKPLQLPLNNTLPDIKSCIAVVDLTLLMRQINWFQIKNRLHSLARIEKIMRPHLFDGWAELGLLHQCASGWGHYSFWDENRESTSRQSRCSRNELDAIQNVWAAQHLLGCKARSWGVSGRSKESATEMINRVGQFLCTADIHNQTSLTQKFRSSSEQPESIRKS